MSVAYIAPDRSFAAELANNLLRTYADLAEVIVFLPSQRSRRALKEALLVANDGKALLMPRLFPLAQADIELLIPEVVHAKNAEPLPPAIGEMERLAKLARLIEAKATGMALSAEEVLHMAQSFARLSDDFTLEQQPIGALETLVPEDMAEHWQASLDLLSVVMHEWPALLREEGEMDALDRRNREMAVLAAHWKAHPPQTPIIAAGTTGSIPATARLLDVIKDLPQGLVVLPGLDCGMKEDEWRLLKPSHPQYGLRHLLQEMKIERKDVKPLSKRREESPRTAFLRAVMAPPECTHAWKNISLDWNEALEGITLVGCHDEHEEAGIISLMLRQVLEEKQATGMLVTHDRELARQVASMMRRYGVEIDDSAGKPLTDTVPFVFFHHVMSYALSDGDPLMLLALLKHPLLRLSKDAVVMREAARHVEKTLLRGVRSWNHREQLEEKAQQDITNDEEAATLLRRLHRAMKPLFEMTRPSPVSFRELLRTHRAVAEELALPGHLVDSDEGRQLMACLDVLEGEGEAYGFIHPKEYPGIVSLMLAGKHYRKPYSTHPRLHILSPLEARMQQADYVILGGMNEESWPPAPGIDPWLSLPMREKAGLKSHAHQVGLSAHDFWMLAHAPNVMITHAARKHGTPAVASRWLLRMQALLEAAPKNTQAAFARKGAQWQAWQHVYSQAESIPAAARPSPIPDTSVRPKTVPVTSVQTLRDDPYAFYTEKILGLKKLDAIDKAPDSAEFGTAVHAALRRFFTDYPQMPDRAEDTLYVYLSKEIQKELAHNRASLFWEQRLRFIASRAIELARQHEHPSQLFLEKEIQWQCAGITLNGRIDRQEIYPDGAAIIDYKTGTPPKLADIVQGKQPQLALFGLMVARAEKTPVRSVTIWPLKGRAEDDKVISVEGKEKITTLLEETEQGVTALLEAFNKPDMPYLSLADQQEREGDYDHLARKGEWV